MNVAQHLLIFGIRIYRWGISPAKSVLFGPLGRCRFTPSCSAYALEAIREHGVRAGSWLALKRLGRCHPWGGCGADPVPVRPGRTGNEGPSVTRAAPEEPTLIVAGYWPQKR